MKRTEREQFIRTLQNRVEECLLASGLSAREASIRATGSDQTIPSIRKGKIPSAAAISGLAQTFGYSVDYMVGNEGSPNERPPAWDIGSRALNRYRRARMIEDELQRIDRESVRALRRAAIGKADRLDVEQLEFYEKQAEDLRRELRDLTN